MKITIRMKKFGIIGVYLNDAVILNRQWLFGVYLVEILL